MPKAFLILLSVLVVPAAAAGDRGNDPPARGARPVDGPSLAGVDGSARRVLSCTFSRSPTDCGFRVQEKAPGRASLVDTGRAGGKALRLRTEPGDDQVTGSGTHERTDVWLTQKDTGCYEGREQVWEHSILFPDDYVAPPKGWGVVFDFHQSDDAGGGQANFHVFANPGGLRFLGFGGPKVNRGSPQEREGRYSADIAPITRNVWYDFVYHVKWSSREDGFFHAWVNGVRKLEHFGPTLYAGQGCYLKLANYHVAFGRASSVIHDRVIRHDIHR
jgi:Polysaccharide lyase